MSCARLGHRAQALRLWAERGEAADAEIRRMIEGRPALGSLDVLAQKRVGGLTRRVIDAMLAPKWLQTELTIAHARLFFEGYAPPAATGDAAPPAEEIGRLDTSLADYVCYVMLDFVTADRGLERLPLAAAILLSRKLGLEDRFAGIAAKELSLRKAQLERLQHDAEAMVAEADRRPAAP